MATLQLALQKTSSIKVFDQPRQAFRALVGMGKPPQQQIVRPQDIANPRVGESFTHLKLTAEKMLQEQACVKSDLEIANAKLAKAHEGLRALEEKNQEISNENAMLKVKHCEDTKLWSNVETKVSSATAFFDQITETLQALENQVQQAESAKKLIEERLQTRDEAIERDLTRLRTSLEETTVKLEIAEKNSEYKQLLHKEQESAAQKIAALEKTLVETRKQAEIQLEAKQADIAKHLRDLSQKNDQAMQEMKRHEISKLQESHKQALEAASSKTGELQSKCDKLVSSMKKVEEEMDSVKARNADFVERERQLQTDLADKEKSLALASRENCDLEKKLNCQIIDMQRQHAEALTRLETELETLKSQNKDLLEREKQQDTDLADKEKQLAILLDEKSELEKKLTEVASLPPPEAPPLATTAQIPRPSEVVKQTELAAKPETASVPKDLEPVTRKAEPELEPVVRKTEVAVTAKGVTSKSKKTYAKRKRAQGTEAATRKLRSTSRKKASKKKTERTSDDDSDGGGDDLFGDGCLDPYADDPYSFG